MVTQTQSTKYIFKGSALRFPSPFLDNLIILNRPIGCNMADSGLVRLNRKEAPRPSARVAVSIGMSSM